MTFENLVDFIVGASIWSVLKIFVIIALIIYAIFSVVIIKQVNLMTKVVSGNLDSVVKLIAWIHFFFSLAIILLAIIVL